jgi:polynucleotide 5'-kinase involved in rRNA processing
MPAVMAHEAPASLERRIFNEVYSVYVPGERLPALDGVARLEDISRAVNLKPGVLHPRRFVTVMIVGNHSSGKSSFINWRVAAAVAGVPTRLYGWARATKAADMPPRLAS